MTQEKGDVGQYAEGALDCSMGTNAQGDIVHMGKSLILRDNGDLSDPINLQREVDKMNYVTSKLNKYGDTIANGGILSEFEQEEYDFLLTLPD